MKDGEERQKFNILVVDDQVAEETAREIRDSFDSTGDFWVEVSVETDFDRAAERLVAEDFDVVVLDVMLKRRPGDAHSGDDADAGIKTLDIVRKAKFMPVVFYTARHLDVQDQARPPFVQVLSKDEIEDLPDALRKAMQSNIQLVSRKLKDHVDSAIREFLWLQVSQHPQEYDLAPSPEISSGGAGGGRAVT